MSLGFVRGGLRLLGIGLAGILATGVVGGASIVACSSNQILPIKEPDKCTLQIIGVSVISSPRINPSESGCPRPVQLRLYQLKSDAHLLNASFQEVWKDDKKTFGDDLVSVQEISVYPDTRQELKFERSPDALILAAVALFRNPKGKNWFYTWELPPAPGKGDCGMPKCTSEECADAGKEPPNLNPKFAVWLDESRVDEGEDHLDEHPTGAALKDLKQCAPPPALPGPAAPPPPPQGGKGIR
jgi:type VI secretion system VasD/TssJ family lipoprotein